MKVTYKVIYTSYRGDCEEEPEEEPLVTSADAPDVTVYEDDDYDGEEDLLEVDTGLVTEHGEPIVRVVQRARIGFL